jgi:hypothetical protein
MPFVRRDANGAIVEALDEPTEEVIEFLEADDHELQRFASRHGDEAQIREQLSVTDADMIRVVEDLIEVLITKSVISAADLPGVVNAKLARRRELRKTMSSLSRLISED